MSFMSGRDATLLSMLALLGDVSQAEADDTIRQIQSPYARQVARALTGAKGEVSEVARKDAENLRQWAEELPESPYAAAR